MAVPHLNIPLGFGFYLHAAAWRPSRFWLLTIDRSVWIEPDALSLAALEILNKKLTTQTIGDRVRRLLEALMASPSRRFRLEQLHAR